MAWPLISSSETPAQPRVLTGHDEGLITIALKEGDDVERERMRSDMGELYRTPLGHFRHEIGHHYWDLLIANTGYLEPCRRHFGDETVDYEEALKAHYARAPMVGWQRTAMSAPTPPAIPGRISPKPGRITCTSSTRWKWHRPSASASTPKAGPRPRHAGRHQFRPV